MAMANPPVTLGKYFQKTSNNPHPFFRRRFIYWDMKDEIIIIDYGMGNLFSLRKIIERIGYSCKISSSHQDIQSAGRIILPGVGHFGKAMFNLKQSHLVEELNEAALVKKIPVMGICLGMQLMAGHSEEGDAAGLKWFDARVVKFRVKNTELYKVPHVGWNTSTHEKPHSPILRGVDSSDEFYFVHSYHIVTNNEEDVLGKTNYEYSFVSAIQKENIVGVQFHPEKSHKAGEQLIKNFLSS
jgi:glutamine amidotransferase